MSTKLIAVLAGGAALIGVGNAVAVAGTASKGPTCKYMLTNTPLGGGKGTEGGTVTCPKPAGKGTAMSNYTYSGTTTVTINGKFTDTFTHGTIKGTFTLKGSTVSSLTGHFKIKSGTGKLAAAHGSGTEKCTSTDAGATFNCTAVLTKGKF